VNVLSFLFADLTPVSAVFGSIGAYAAGCSLLYLTCDAELADFNPLPVVRRSAESGRLMPVWQVAVHAGHDVNRAIASGQKAIARSCRPSCEALRDAAALLLLLTTSPKGALA
jgi:hypothetical protein